MPELIELTNCIVNDKMIIITSSGTSHANVSHAEFICPDELLADYREVIRLARLAGVTIAYKQGTKRKINEVRAQYLADYNTYCELYIKLKTLWNQKLEKGLVCGYANNKDELMKTITATDNSMSKLFWGNNPLSFMSGRKARMRDLLTELKHIRTSKHVSKATIWL